MIMLQAVANFFQTDLSYILKGGSWLGVGRVVSFVASSLLLLAFGNLVPKATYGTYQYVLSIAAILTVATLPGMNTALTQAVAHGNEGVFYEMTRVRIRWGLIGGLLSLIVGTYYFVIGDAQLTLAFLIVASFIPFMDSLTLWSAVFFGRKDFKHSSIFSTLFGLLQVSSILLALSLTTDVTIIIAVYFISTTVIRMSLTLIFHFFYTPNSEVSENYISYGKHLSLMAVLGAISSEADKVLLWHFLGPSALATYTFALGPVVYVQSCFRSLESLAFPKLASTHARILRKTLPTKLIRLFIVIVPCVVVYVMLAPTLYGIFFPQYIGSATFSQALSLLLLFLPQKLLGATLRAKSQKKALYIVATVNPLVRIVLLVFLVPAYGIWGAVFAVIIPAFLNLLAMSHFFRRI